MSKAAKSEDGVLANPEQSAKDFKGKFIPTDQITADPKANGRFAPPSQEKLEELKTSIAEHGQRQPGEVIKDGPDHYLLASGYGRFRAIKILNQGRPEEQKIKFKAIVIEANTQKAFELNLEENLRRNDLTAMDLAYSMNRLKDEFGYDNDALGDFFRLGSGTIINLLSLNRLSPEHQKKIHTGEVSPSVGFQLSAAPSEKRKVMLEEAEEESKAEGKKRASFKNIQKAARKHTKKAVSISYGEFKEFLTGTDEKSSVWPYSCVLLDLIEGKETPTDTFNKLEKLAQGKKVDFFDRSEKEEVEAPAKPKAVKEVKAKKAPAVKAAAPKPKVAKKKAKK